MDGWLRGLAGQPGFQRWGGAAQHQPGPAALGPEPGHVPGVITGHGAVLFVGAVVLLIQHDQPQGGHGQKDGRAGAHGDQRITLQAAAPGGHPFRFPHAAVEFHHCFAKALAAAIEQLGNEADFRGEQQTALACGQGLGGGLEVNLGFPRTGYPP